MTEAGFTEQQAEVQIAVLAEAITGELATRRDLQEVEMRLHQKIESRGVELEGKIEALRVEMKNMETRLMVRLGALMIVGITALGVLIKIL